MTTQILYPVAVYSQVPYLKCEGKRFNVGTKVYDNGIPYIVADQEQITHDLELTKDIIPVELYTEIKEKIANAVLI